MTMRSNISTEEKQILDELENKIINYNDNYNELSVLDNKCRSARIAMDQNEGQCYNLGITFC